MRTHLLLSKGRHPLLLSALSALWLATLANVPLWRKLTELPELQNIRGLIFAAGFALALFLFLFACINLLGWHRWLKPVIAVFLVSAAIGAYFMASYGVVIDSTMMMNVLQTDTREFRDLVNWHLIVYVVVLGVAPSALLWGIQVRRLRLRRLLAIQLGAVLASLAAMIGVMLLIYQDFSSVMRNHTQVRYLINPLNSFYAVAKVAGTRPSGVNHDLRPIGTDARISAARPGDKPPLLVLVLGETARSASFGINGYLRQTTPRLSNENVISLRNVWSCGTSTAVSLPCMFSNLGRAGFNTGSARTENLLDVLYRSGLAVLWLDNQAGCKKVCDRVPTQSTEALSMPGFCPGGECFDEAMLQNIDERIAQFPAERRARGVVVVMHQMGSHGPAYYKRTPPDFKQFQPECQSNALQTCERAQVVNTYDNTILYTDYFLSRTIAWLKASENTSATAMVYLSDHGESLGENNLYLHGLPYAAAPTVQKQVPWITWISRTFETQRAMDLRCLRDKVETSLSHDNYFHSVLGLIGVQTRDYRAALDIYASCRASAGDE